MARQLIDSLSAPFEPTRFRDDYREQVLELIERKAAGEEVAIQPVAETPAEVPDLMAALEASVATVRGDGSPAARRTRQKRRPESGAPERARAGSDREPEPSAPTRVRSACAGSEAGSLAQCASGHPLVPCGLLSVFATPAGTQDSCTRSSRHRPLASTTPNTSTTPAVSRSWQRSRRAPTTASSIVRCTRSRTSSTAARPARTRRPATARASCCSCPTSSSAPSRRSSCRRARPLRRRRAVPVAGAGASTTASSS